MQKLVIVMQMLELNQAILKQRKLSIASICGISFGFRGITSKAILALRYYRKPVSLHKTCGFFLWATTALQPPSAAGIASPRNTTTRTTVPCCTPSSEEAPTQWFVHTCHAQPGGTTHHRSASSGRTAIPSSDGFVQTLTRRERLHAQENWCDASKWRGATASRSKVKVQAKVLGPRF